MSEEREKDPNKLQMNRTHKLMIAGLVLVVVGILATYLPSNKDEVPTAVETLAQDVAVETQPFETELTYEELLEMRLESILAQLEGAGTADVMVTVSAGQEKVLAEEVVECVQNTNESSQSGSNKNTTRQDQERKIVMQDGDTPFVVKENRPEIEGVLVLAEGANDVNIKNAIIQAVSSVLDVPVHKIAVYKMAEN